MTFIKKLLVALIVLLSITSSNAQIKYSKIETVKIYGNCGSCKKNIETAGNLKKVAFVNWDKTSKTAVITFDSTKTNANEILKRIALAGYDSDSFLAPTDAYSKLDGCCQYERTAKVTTKKWEDAQMASTDTKPMHDMSDMAATKKGDTKMASIDTKPMHDMSDMAATKKDDAKMASTDTKPMHDMSDMAATKKDDTKMMNKPGVSDTMAIPVSTVNPFIAVFNNYFLLKDALIKTDVSGATATSNNLLTTLTSIKMEELSMDVHTVWMKVMKDLSFDAEHISESKDIAHQREHFSSLSKNMYALMKVSKSETETFYQFCPMYNKGKGANWLSKEDEIKNPYYGSQMLSCGRTVETIK